MQSVGIVLWTAGCVDVTSCLLTSKDNILTKDSVRGTSTSNMSLKELTLIVCTDQPAALLVKLFLQDTENTHEKFKKNNSRSRNIYSRGLRVLNTFHAQRPRSVFGGNVKRLIDNQNDSSRNISSSYYSDLATEPSINTSQRHSTPRYRQSFTQFPKIHSESILLPPLIPPENVPLTLNNSLDAMYTFSIHNLSSNYSFKSPDVFAILNLTTLQIQQTNENNHVSEKNSIHVVEISDLMGSNENDTVSSNNLNSHPIPEKEGLSEIDLHLHKLNSDTPLNAYGNLSSLSTESMLISNPIRFENNLNLYRNDSTLNESKNSKINRHFQDKLRQDTLFQNSSTIYPSNILNVNITFLGKSIPGEEHTYNNMTLRMINIILQAVKKLELDIKNNTTLYNETIKEKSNSDKQVLSTKQIQLHIPSYEVDVIDDQESAASLTTKLLQNSSTGSGINMQMSSMNNNISNTNSSYLSLFETTLKKTAQVFSSVHAYWNNFNYPTIHNSPDNKINLIANMSEDAVIRTKRNILNDITTNVSTHTALRNVPRFIQDIFGINDAHIVGLSKEMRENNSYNITFEGSNNLDVMHTTETTNKTEEMVSPRKNALLNFNGSRQTQERNEIPVRNNFVFRRRLICTNVTFSDPKQVLDKITIRVKLLRRKVHPDHYVMRQVPQKYADMNQIKKVVHESNENENIKNSQRSPNIENLEQWQTREKILSLPDDPHKGSSVNTVLCI